MRNPAAGYDVVILDATTRSELLRLYFIADSVNRAQEQAIAYVGNLGLMFVAPGNFEPSRGGGGTVYAYFRQWTPPTEVSPISVSPPSPTVRDFTPSGVYDDDEPIPPTVVTPRVPAEPPPAPAPRKRGRPRKDKTAVESPVDYVAKPRTKAKAPKPVTPEKLLSEVTRLAEILSDDSDNQNTRYLSEFLELHPDVLQLLAKGGEVPEKTKEFVRTATDAQLAVPLLNAVKDYKEWIKENKNKLQREKAQEVAYALAQTATPFKLSDGTTAWQLDSNLYFNGLLAGTYSSPIFFVVAGRPWPPLAFFEPRNLRQMDDVTQEMSKRRPTIFKGRQVYVYDGGLAVTWGDGRGRIRRYSQIGDQNVLLARANEGDAVLVILKDPNLQQNPRRRRY